MYSILFGYVSISIEATTLTSGVVEELLLLEDELEELLLIEELTEV